MDFRIIPIPDDDLIMHTVAAWSIDQWGADFPDDSIDTYVQLYKQSVHSNSGMPRVFVAVDSNNKPCGTITCIDDDDLPNATEKGPWLAALYVEPEHRESGIGRALVDTVIQHARACRFSQMYLYTENHVAWYETMGWNAIRQAPLSDHLVTVMTRDV